MEDNKVKYTKQLISCGCVVLSLGAILSVNIPEIKDIPEKGVSNVEITTNLMPNEIRLGEYSTISGNDTSIVVENESSISESGKFSEVIEEVELEEENEEAKVETLYDFEVSDNKYSMYTSTALNIRTVPSTIGSVIGYYKYGDLVQVTGDISDSTWVRVADAGVEGYCNKKYLQEEEPKRAREVIEIQDEQIPTTVTDTGIIKNSGNASSTVVNSVYQNYCLIPENLRHHLENNGYQVLVTSDNFGASYGYSKSILALIEYDIKTIYVDNRSEAASSIIHEVGHYLDWCFGFKGYQTEFSLIWLEELDSFKSFSTTHKDNYSTPNEYFAESFATCILQGNTMKEKCPKTYEYIMNLVNQLQ